MMNLIACQQLSHFRVNSSEVLLIPVNYTKVIFLDFPPKQNRVKNNKKLGIYSKNHGNSKNNKPTVQLDWFL